MAPILIKWGIVPLVTAGYCDIFQVSVYRTTLTRTLVHNNKRSKRKKKNQKFKKIEFYKKKICKNKNIYRICKIYVFKNKQLYSI